MLARRGRWDWWTRRPSSSVAPAPVAAPAPEDLPTIFHVTHWKAGSQWINKILNRCVGERVVFAEPGAAQLLKRPIFPGRVYTTCYVTRELFHRVHLPEPWNRFVVIRDLRDALVSQYFSVRFSHPLVARAFLPAGGLDATNVEDMATFRRRFQTVDAEEGMLALLDRLAYSASIQWSWLEGGEPLIRYEDLLARDVEILVPLLTQTCPLGVPAEQVREAVVACRFETLTGGRGRGQEDVHSHERKGVVGDWRTHFTPRLTRAFKARFGDLLVATGYERDTHW